MVANYAAICEDEERRDQTIKNSVRVLAELYADHAHFILELLQNAEDALARRTEWQGSQAVSFILSATELRIAHWGHPFDEEDVRKICAIGESTKDLTAIGRFGIGFKSVYAFTDRPEVHSGDEDFAVDGSLNPIPSRPVDRQSDETIFVIPLRPQDANAHAEVAKGLRCLGPRTLLFLRQIEEIAWSVEGGPSGLYLRSKPEAMGKNVGRITVIGQEEGKPHIEETWLVFSREATTDEGAFAGHVEIAFSIAQDKDSRRWSVQAVSDSPLVVFFPTVVPTYLGFLVQGPYRTTPSRDNVPRSDLWNQQLVEGTATLLVEALRWMRDNDMLDTAALGCLPLDRARFGEGNMFALLFETTRAALASEALLPQFGSGHVSATNARLARTKELRELFDPSQLAALFGHDGELAWLSGDITQDHTPELRRYLMHELEIAEVTPAMILPKLDKPFLEAQPDAWILKLYEFLNGQSSVQRRLDVQPLIRLKDGSHVPARSNDRLRAFLPSAIETDFPTVRLAVCATDEAWKFLESLGLTKPDPVDDVVRNILPRYRAEELDVDDAEYDADIQRIRAAFGSDSDIQRDKLVAALRESFFIMVVDAGDGAKRWAKAGELYLATERLKELFAGVSNVLVVDDSHSCLRGEDVRNLLEACGATRYLKPLRVEVPWEKLLQLRERAEATRTKSKEYIEDYSIHGLELLLRSLPTLELSQQRQKTGLLWEALSDLEQQQRSVFTGKYRGHYYGPRRCDFEPAFVELLHDTAWVPDANGDLQQPEFVLFDTLGWKSNLFLLSKIRFKPSNIETLAKEAGIEPGVLDWLKKHDVTSVAELETRLGIKEKPRQPEDEPSPQAVDDGSEKPSVPGPTGLEPSGSCGGVRSGGADRGTGARDGGGTREGTKGGVRTSDRTQGAGTGRGTRTPGSTGGRPFISYVGAHPDEEKPDPDDLDRQTRMALEEKAIKLVLAQEPELQRTPPNNPGYDLFEAGEDGALVRWVEVKAMTGCLNDRPVGLSRTQFDCARDHGEAYWLYVVEHAGDDHSARIVRIQNPAGKARTFTFDRGWLDVAEVDSAAD